MSDAAEIITVTLGFKTFRCCRHCAAHLEDTIADLAKNHPTARLIVLQSPFNDDVEASAGSHDKCSAFDVVIQTFGWFAAQRFLRAHGYAAWYREAVPGLWGDHIHMASLNCPAPVGDLIPGQLADYLATPPRNGLRGHAVDNTWHPTDINATRFDYPRWLRDQEDAMPFTDWPQADKNALVAAVVDGLLSAAVEDGVTARLALSRASRVPAKLDAKTSAILAAIKAD
jgi:hypothetical protein